MLLYARSKSLTEMMWSLTRATTFIGARTPPAKPQKMKTMTMTENMTFKVIESAAFFRIEFSTDGRSYKPTYDREAPLRKQLARSFTLPSPMNSGTHGAPNEEEPADRRAMILNSLLGMFSN